MTASEETGASGASGSFLSDWLSKVCEQSPNYTPQDHRLVVGPAVAGRLREMIGEERFGAWCAESTPMQPPFDLVALAQTAAAFHAKRRELHCHPAVVDALRAAVPETSPPLPPRESMGWLSGIPITEKPELAPGYWQIREDGRVVAFGRVTAPAKPGT